MAPIVAFVAAHAVAIAVVGALAVAGYALYQSSLYETPKGERPKQNVMVQEADVPRRIVFGRTRIGGVVVERGKAFPDSDDLHIAVVFCEGEATIQHIYLADELICLEQDGVDADSHPVYIPCSEVKYYVESRTGGTTTLDIIDKTTWDAVTTTYNGNPVARKFEVDSRKFAGHLTIQLYDGTQTVANAALVANLPAWTSDHKLLGLTYAVITMTKNPEVFPRGVDAISAIVDGYEVYDPRDESTGYSSNPALIWYHWKTNSPFGRGVATTDIDTEAVKTAADICDESVSTVYGGTEPRYSCHGIWYMDEEPEVFEKHILATMDGYAPNLGGYESLYAGKYITPTFTLLPNHVVGPIKSKTRLPKKDQVKVVKGTFMAPENNWNKTSFPSVRNSPSDASDEKVADLNLVMVSSPSQAQRLAMRFMKRARLERRLQGSFNIEAMRAISGGPVQVSLGERFGMDGKPANVLGWGMAIDKNGEMKINLSLRETDPDIDVFDPETDEQEVVVPSKEAEDGAFAAKPTADNEPGVYLESQFPLDVALSTVTPGATIRWSRTGDVPTSTSGSAYTGAISVASGGLIFARAFADGFSKSSLFSGVYYSAKVETPQVSLPAGEYADGYFPDDVTITCATVGASIRYSLSGDITSETDGTAYSAPVTIPADGGTLRARAFAPGFEASEQITIVYTETA